MKHATLVGYTLGNPMAYEPALDRGPVHKDVGGAYFASREEAQAALGDDERLPACWFPPAIIPKPGRVYELHSEAGHPCRVSDDPADEVGARFLSSTARVRRIGEVPA